MRDFIQFIIIALFVLGFVYLVLMRIKNERDALDPNDRAKRDFAHVNRKKITDPQENLKENVSRKNIKFKNNNEAFLFACEHSNKLEIYNPLVGIVREISTSRYINDITKFAPKYTLEIALKESPFKTTAHSVDREYQIDIGDLVLWIPVDIDAGTNTATGALHAVIKPEISLDDGWKIKKVFK